MAINLSAQYPGKVGPVVPGVWPYGEPQNITVPGDNTGTPWEEALAKDIIGLQQALLTSAGIAPSGTPDQVGTSEYLQALSELSAGRGFSYATAGTANAITLAKSTNQESIRSYFTNLTLRFTAGSTNTAAATVNVSGLGIKVIVNANGVALGAGDIVAGSSYLIMYNGVSFVLLDFLSRNGGILTANDTHLSLKTRNNTFSDIISTDSTNILRALMRHSISTGNTTLDVRNAAGVVQGTLTIKQNGNITISAAVPLVAADITRKDYVDAAVASAGKGLFLLSSQIITSTVSTVDFTGLMDATYDNYILEYENLLAVGTAIFGVRVYTGGGLQSGATDYKVGAANSSDMVINTPAGSNVALNGGSNGVIKVYNAPNTVAKKFVTIENNFETNGGTITNQHIAHRFEQAAAITGLQIKSGAANNIASGRFRLYGLSI